MFFVAGSSSPPTGEVFFFRKKRKSFDDQKTSQQLPVEMNASVKTPGIWKVQQDLGLQRGSVLEGKSPLSESTGEMPPPPKNSRPYYCRIINHHHLWITPFITPYFFGWYFGGDALKLTWNNRFILVCSTESRRLRQRSAGGQQFRCLASHSGIDGGGGTREKLGGRQRSNQLEQWKNWPLGCFGVYNHG